MKKRIVAVATILAVSLTGTAFAATGALKGVFVKPYVYVVNGQAKTMGAGYQTLEYQNRAYVPVRFVSEALGMNVQYVEKGQVINITSPKKPMTEDEICPYITTNDKIRALEEKVKKLEKENADLKQTLKDNKTSVENEFLKKTTNHHFDKLPVSELDDNIKVTVKGYGFDNGDRDLYLNIRVENVNEDNESFQLSPSETKISLNGKEYKGDVGNGGLTLYNMLSNKKDHTDGSVVFKGIDRSNENDEYLIRFVYTDASGVKKQTLITRFKLK